MDMLERHGPAARSRYPGFCDGPWASWTGSWRSDWFGNFHHIRVVGLGRKGGKSAPGISRRRVRIHPEELAALALANVLAAAKPGK